MTEWSIIAAALLIAGFPLYFLVAVEVMVRWDRFRGLRRAEDTSSNQEGGSQ